MSTSESKETYIIAPGSAEPWPQAIFDRMDPDAVEDCVRRINEHEDQATPEQLERCTSPSGFYISDTDRQLLRRIGGPASEVALMRLGDN